MKKAIFIFLLSFVSFHIYGQSVWQANIRPVEAKGYYNIELDQPVIAKSAKKDLSDLKILDSRNNEIPYFLRSVSPVYEVSRFENYALKQNLVRDSLNIVVVDNAGLEDIDRFYIVIRSADVDKYASVRGSNDLSQWYIVKQKIAIAGLGYKQANNEEILLLDIPRGNYKYYEIAIENNQKSPLKVLRVGKFENSSIYGQFTEIDPGRFVRKDSTDKKTYIRFPDIQDTYKINRLEISVQNDAFFLRDAFMVDTLSGRSFDFRLSSKTDNSFFADNFPLGKHTFIAIENNSNLPLEIVSVKAYGLNRYLCAYLEKGQEYYLQAGITENGIPEYDIEHFKSEIPVDLPIVKTYNLHSIPNAVNTPQRRELSLIEKPVFLWSVIILIGLFLTFVCFKTIKEMRKKK